MVRTHFGISAFGINAYIADEEGGVVISEHDELGQSAGRHEELYFVSDGHAAFTVDGDEIDAPAGTFVFVRDPAAKRKAVAKKPGTTILIAGGKPGEAFTPSPWERSAPALAFFGTGEYDKAIEVFKAVLAEFPDDGGARYNLACAQSMSGSKDEALENLRRSTEVDPSFRKLAEKDSDFDPIRDDPEFASAIAGQPDAGGSGS